MVKERKRAISESDGSKDSRQKEQKSWLHLKEWKYLQICGRKRTIFLLLCFSSSSFFVQRLFAFSDFFNRRIFSPGFSMLSHSPLPQLPIPQTPIQMFSEWTLFLSLYRLPLSSTPFLRAVVSHCNFQFFFYKNWKKKERLCFKRRRIQWNYQKFEWKRKMMASSELKTWRSFFTKTRYFSYC